MTSLALLLCRFSLHDQMQFKGEDVTTSFVTRTLGNVTEDNEIFFEFTVKSPTKAPPSGVTPVPNPDPKGPAVLYNDAGMGGCPVAHEGASVATPGSA